MKEIYEFRYSSCPVAHADSWLYKEAIWIIHASVALIYGTCLPQLED